MKSSSSLINKAAIPIFAGIAGAAFLGYSSTLQSIDILVLCVVSIAIFSLSFFSVTISLQLLIVSMLLSPEIPVYNSAVRDITIRFDDVILTVMIFSWLLRMAILKGTGFVLKNPLNPSIIIFSIICILSTALGVGRGEIKLIGGFFFVLKFIEYFILYIIVINYVQDFETINKLLTTMLIVFCIVCIYGIYRIITGQIVTTPFELGEPERNTLGGYLALMGAVASGVMLYTKSKLEKRLLVLVIPIAIGVLVFSLSRSGWLSAIVVIAVLFYYVPFRNVYFVLAIIIVGVIPFIAPDVATERVNKTFTEQALHDRQITVGGVTLDASSSARLISWQFVMNEFFKHPFIGFGVTGFGFIDGQFFKILIELGSIGLISFLFLQVSVNRQIARTINLDLEPRVHGMMVGFMAGFWGIMAHSLTANSFVIIRIAEPFWCLAGLAFVVKKLTDEKIEEEIKLLNSTNVLE